MNHAAFPDFTPDEGVRGSTACGAADALVRRWNDDVLDCCNARCSALLAATQIGR
jgi:hypothetical protein